MPRTAAAETSFPQDGKALIIGLPPESAVLIKHGDKVSFVEDPSDIHSASDLPVGTVAICLHALMPGDETRLKELATREGVPVSVTGGIPGLMERLVYWHVPTIGNGAKQVHLGGTPSPERAETMTKKQTRGRGVVKAFVLKHGNLRAESLGEEARRLLALAKKENLDTTEGSLYQSLLVARKEKGIDSGRKTSTPRAVHRHAAKLAHTNGNLTDLLKSMFAADKAHSDQQKEIMREIVKRVKSAEAENAQLRKSFDRLAAVRTEIKALQQLAK